MKVILLEDVKKQGKKDDIIDVSDGYANNFLIKKGLAVPVTRTSKQKLDSQIETRKQNEEELIASCGKVKKDLEKITLSFKVNVGTGDKVFGNVSTKQISEELKKKKFNIDKKKIIFDHELNSLGSHDVKIELHKKVIANIKIVLEK